MIHIKKKSANLAVDQSQVLVDQLLPKGLGQTVGRQNFRLQFSNEIVVRARPPEIKPCVIVLKTRIIKWNLTKKTHLKLSGNNFESVHKNIYLDALFHLIWDYLIFVQWPEIETSHAVSFQTRQNLLGKVSAKRHLQKVENNFFKLNTNWKKKFKIASC
jgi:hypothetical protein